MNGGHPVKGVYSPLEVHHGPNATHLHSRVQGGGRQARHRARLLRRRGRSLGIKDNLLRNCKQALDAQGEQAFPGRGKLSPFEEENRRLRAENKRLLAERDIVQKAAAFFAKEAL